MGNMSVITVFTLSGFGDITDYRVPVFSVTLLCYCVIVLVNVTVIMTIIFNRIFHVPMYIFLCNLCINGLFGTAGFYPKFLTDLQSRLQVISYAACLFQAFFIYSSVCIDLCLLAVMAYDWFVAICRPLQYHSVMTKQRVAQLVSFSWIAPFGLTAGAIIFTSQIRLCGSHIQKLYCANWLVAKLSCDATSWVTSSTPTNVVAYVTILFYIFLAIFIVCSYMQLIRSCFKSLENRGKFMSTCLPHLFALFNISIAALFDVLHMRYGSNDLPQSLQNFLAVEILIGPPLFNPLIYGLTLTQIRNKILCRCLKRK
ncbi:olfactory receptor 1D2-like [Osmerus mordax]|uniref:olfactory receptor 1D2-like n=1 Tax=Osmerus mordax TaxID=8014 RepID=UPI00350FCEB6